MTKRVYIKIQVYVDGKLIFGNGCYMAKNSLDELLELLKDE